MFFETVPFAVEEIVSNHLKKAHQSAVWLQDKRRQNSLHDFRVQLRKITSWLQIIFKYWPDVVSKHMIQVVKNLASSTNLSRDLEVQLEIAVSMRSNWLVSKLEGELEKVRDTAGRDFGADFFKVEQLILAATQKLKLEQTPHGISIQEFFSKEVSTSVNDVFMKIERVSVKEDVKAIHKTRLAVKHLRYLIEPFESKSVNLKLLVQWSRKMQDALGGLHDLYIFRKDLKRQSLHMGGKTRKALQVKSLLKEISQREKELFQIFLSLKNTCPLPMV